MEVLAMLRNIVSQCAKVITFGAQIQGKAKNELITSLQDICDKCENSYSQVLAKLLPIKNSFNDDSLPYTFFLLNGDMELNKNRQIFVNKML